LAAPEWGNPAHDITTAALGSARFDRGQRLFDLQMVDRVRTRLQVSLRASFFAFRSVQRAGWRGVIELLDGSCNPAPGRSTVIIALGLPNVSTRGALLQCLLTVALEHQAGGTPDIDLGYHAARTARLRSPNI
jgi:hypothetical protein